MYVYSIYNDMCSTWYTPRLTHPQSNVFFTAGCVMLPCCRTTAFSSMACLGGSNDELKQQVWVLINSDNQDTPRYSKGTLRKTQETSIPCNENTMRPDSVRAGKCFYVDSLVYSMA